MRFLLTGGYGASVAGSSAIYSIVTNRFAFWISIRICGDYGYC